MTNVNITNFRKNIYNLIEQTIKYNEPIYFVTDNGNDIILYESDYNNLMETLYISSMPKLKEDILKGLKEDIKDCVNEDEVEWQNVQYSVQKASTERYTKIKIISV